MQDLSVIGITNGQPLKHLPPKPHILNVIHKTLSHEDRQKILEHCDSCQYASLAGSKITELTSLWVFLQKFNEIRLIGVRGPLQPKYGQNYSVG